MHKDANTHNLVCTGFSHCCEKYNFETIFKVSKIESQWRVSLFIFVFFQNPAAARPGTRGGQVAGGVGELVMSV